MFGIGATELVIIMVVALLVFGPKRLPELARSLGRGMAEFRRASSDLRQTLQEAELSPDAPDPPEADPAPIVPSETEPQAIAPPEATPQDPEPVATPQGSEPVATPQGSEPVATPSSDDEPSSRSG